MYTGGVLLACIFITIYNVSLHAGTQCVVSNCLVEANKSACLRGVQPLHDRMAPGGSGALQKERAGGCPTRRARPPSKRFLAKNLGHSNVLGQESWAKSWQDLVQDH